MPDDALGNVGLAVISGCWDFISDDDLKSSNDHTVIITLFDNTLVAATADVVGHLVRLSQDFPHIAIYQGIHTTLLTEQATGCLLCGKEVVDDVIAIGAVSAGGLGMGGGAVEHGPRGLAKIAHGRCAIDTGNHVSYDNLIFFFLVGIGDHARQFLHERQIDLLEIDAVNNREGIEGIIDSQREVDATGFVINHVLVDNIGFDARSIQHTEGHALAVFGQFTHSIGVANLINHGFAPKHVHSKTFDDVL